jgi:hypothetical protein
MRRGWGVGIAGLVLSAGLAGPAASGARSSFGAPSELELRVSVYTLIPSEVEVARHTTEALLATAGIEAVWRLCGGEGCAEPSPGRVHLRVLLLPIAKESAPSISGEVARDPVTRAPTVLVYVPRTKDVADRIRRSAEGRAHPVLFTLTTGHVVGVTIAHEVGHSLGLGHGASGPMKAEPDPADLIALRAGKLRFQPGEARTLRTFIIDASRHETGRAGSRPCCPRE